MYDSARAFKRGSQRVRFETDTLRQSAPSYNPLTQESELISVTAIIQMIILSLSMLSVQPHQEPRFLTPLVLPIILLVASSKRSTRLGAWTWIIFNMVLVLVFGFLHQGGVVPSLFYLHSTLGNVSSGPITHIAYWKTYLPPRHLLGVSQKNVQNGKIFFTDLAGAPQDQLVAALSSGNFERTFLVTTMAMYAELPVEVSSCMTQQTRIFPHLDLDHIPESVQVGWYDGLSLGVYAVERRCDTDTMKR
ncbi:glycosyltransferase family 22 protein [Hydnomerulius pinastri MD-312]|uniref:Mannosyltransferase n=1 Tax=Hydnomerulius pinastri MD-312 TaxID=994086 RepID=A0A0C9VGM3_9AGAM|nr:glycosyltransferase family 22 protein [Hydnomerulius pinastri MD-312]